MTGSSDSIDESGPLATRDDNQLILALHFVRDAINVSEATDANAS